ncbi:hypothetical protein MSAN_00542900 [Mycena sanguinolenta]|uniref:Uncharacterized protein n=1 Tax=Mycena sanguinolenta TaxID=230812 RepID=A0A8H7DIB3_9AGAR|nr:hypothetical protein MSAN_00542900 [Mycena sanguinolenta]
MTSVTPSTNHPPTPTTTRIYAFHDAVASHLLTKDPKRHHFFRLDGRSGLFAPLLSRAVTAEADQQEDVESDDEPINDTDTDMNQIDTEWPPDPFNQIDEEWPLPDPMNEVDDLPDPPAKRKRKRPAIFEDVVRAGKPPTGAHSRSRARRRHRIATQGHSVKPSVKEAIVSQAVPIPIPKFDASTLPAAHGAYGGKTEQRDETRAKKKRWNVAELLALGFQLIRWDGRTPHPLVDRTRRIFAVLAGQPNDDSYAASIKSAYQRIKTLSASAYFPAAMRRHRRGLFAAINVGLNFGKGATAPAWLDNKNHTPLATQLLAEPDVIRMANFASFAFALWAPRLYALYVDNNKRLHTHSPHLRRPFPQSVFACAAFNFGPRVCTFKHRDVCNLPFGWCAIQSLGNFDAQKGGHLILWDVKLVIEFPAGGLILLPSATIAHSNIPVQDGEERISFTQFTAGGLFRYVDNGFRTQEQLAAEDPEEYERMKQLKGSRWETGLRLFSTIDDLV